MRDFLAFVTAAMMMSLAVQPAQAVEPDAPEQLIPAKEAFGISIRQTLLKSIPQSSPAEEADRLALAEFYISRGHEPLWLTDSGLSDAVDKIRAVIERADTWGLNRKDYPLPEALPANADNQARIDAEIALSMTVLKYARHASNGRVAKPNELSSYLDRHPSLDDTNKVLSAVLSADDPGTYLETLHPKHPQFVKLREKLHAMREGDVKAEAPVLLPSKGPMLKLGVQHPDVVLLRKRLKISDNENDEFDDVVREAVKAFQKENGLSRDGIVGRGTRRALNGGQKSAPTEAMILANMEAWRWMPKDLGEHYIFVNIPEYKFRFHKDGEVVHEERIIVGKRHQQTPVFSDVMETVVLHPQWGVPNSIKVNEVLPALARGRSLARQGLRIQRNGRDIDPNTVDWSRADIRNYHVYQPSGRGNALGEVKFMFPNKHAVYLHDTPTKHLFKTKKRTYSHGCIRVRNPMRLAEILLETDKGWSAGKVATLHRKGPRNNNIPIENKIKVHVSYFTAWVDEDGTLKTWKDIYGHEKRIRLAHAGKHHLINRGRDHLAPVKYDRQKIARMRQQHQGYGSGQTLFEVLFGGF